jgi:hypothetical protein
MSEQAVPDVSEKRVARAALDAAKRNEIIAMVANGSSRRVAARYVGCAPSTITRTADRDPEFAAALARAEERIEVACLRAISTAATTKPSCWRAAAWILERKNPEDFGPRRPDLYDREQVLAMFEQVLATLAPGLPDEPRQQALEKLGLLMTDGERAEKRK